MPKIGIFPIRFLIVSSSTLQSCGSPGPFDKNTASKSPFKIDSAFTFAGYTLTSHPRLKRLFTMPYFAP